MRLFDVIFKYSVTGKEYCKQVFANSKNNATMKVKKLYPGADYLRVYNVRGLYGEFIYKKD